MDIEFRKLLFHKIRSKTCLRENKLDQIEVLRGAHDVKMHIFTKKFE